MMNTCISSMHAQSFNLNFHIKKEAKLQFLQALFPTANKEICMPHGNFDKKEEEIKQKYCVNL